MLYFVGLRKLRIRHRLRQTGRKREQESADRARERDRERAGKKALKYAQAAHTYIQNSTVSLRTISSSTFPTFSALQALQVYQLRSALNCEPPVFSFFPPAFPTQPPIFRLGLTRLKRISCVVILAYAQLVVCRFCGLSFYFIVPPGPTSRPADPAPCHSVGNPILVVSGPSKMPMPQRTHRQTNNWYWWRWVAFQCGWWANWSLRCNVILWNSIENKVDFGHATQVLDYEIHSGPCDAALTKQ